MSNSTNLPSKSLRDKALTMLAYRAQGMTFDEIAPLLGYKNSESCRQMFYHALRKKIVNKDELDLPDDRMEFVVKPKVVDNLEVLLDSADETIKKDVTLATMKHVFNGAGQQGLPTMTAIQVTVVLPDGALRPVREGTIGGIPAVLEAEVDDAS